jgi:class 3 adenylate cyclase
LEGNADHGARAALKCALRMLENLDRLNRELAAELSEPMIIGVGIHTGDAVIGEMGPPKTPVLSALGDAVNTAARLERITKEIDACRRVTRYFGSCAAFESSTLARCFASRPLRAACRGPIKCPKATRIACPELVATTAGSETFSLQVANCA